MKRSPQTKLTSTLSKGAILISAFACASVTAFAQTTIYSDSFARVGNLLGSAPDVRPGSETWVAAAGGRTTDGSILTFTTDRGNAFLPFTPAEGNIYELSVSARTNVTNTAWLALGFMQPGANIGGGGAGNFAFNSSAGGYAWALIRGNGATVTFAGLGGSENQGGDPEGTYASGTFHTIMIRLDTTNPQWSYQAFVNGNAVADAFTYPLGGNPIIGAVGLSTAGGTTVNWDFDDFQLTLIPEPSTYAAIFGGFALLGLVLLRRTRK
ncbi:MAG: PEP-CTERM sorting domain-containing protein [Opitutales bacterium]|nr:PEP-CTERM sorting domain-containing protein [Opitutales bacterium]